MVYVFVINPELEVTTIVIVLFPVLRVMPCDAAPLATDKPLTVIVAPAFATVGVTVMLEIALAMESV
jgi:hypothetical protein